MREFASFLRAIVAAAVPAAVLLVGGSAACFAAAPEEWVGKVIVSKNYSVRIKVDSSWGYLESVRYRKYTVERVEGEYLWVVSNDAADVHGRVKAKEVMTLEAAVGYYTRQIPRNAMLAICRRGIIYEAMGAYDKAMADFNAAIQLKPDSGTPHHDRAILLLRTGGNVDLALADMNIAVAFEERYGRYAPHWQGAAYYDRAYAWACKKEYARAIADYRAAIRKDRSATGPHRDLAWLLATCPDTQFRDAKQALREGLTAYKLTDSRDILAIETVAAAYAEGGEFETAIEWQKKLIEFDDSPRHRPVYERRLALYRKHQPYRQSDEDRADEPIRHDFEH